MEQYLTARGRNGPHKKEEAGAPHQDNRTSSNSFSSYHANQTAGKYTGQLRRRGNAARRLPVLDSGRSDSWHYPALGARGYSAAAVHLLEHGLTPSPNREGLRVMWTRGGHDRQVAELIAQRWGTLA
jgi:hypothetical protein